MCLNCMIVSLYRDLNIAIVKFIIGYWYNSTNLVTKLFICLFCSLQTPFLCVLVSLESMLISQSLSLLGINLCLCVCASAALDLTNLGRHFVGQLGIYSTRPHHHHRQGRDIISKHTLRDTRNVSVNNNNNNNHKNNNNVQVEVFSRNLHDDYQDRYATLRERFVRDCPQDGDRRRLTERRKKTVRFDHGTPRDAWLGRLGRTAASASADPHNKDSGIDTSSTFTSSEDSNRGEAPKVGAC